VPAIEPGPTYGQVGGGFVLDEVFCFKYKRSVGTDDVVSFERHQLQIVPGNGRAGYSRCKVEVPRRLDRSLSVYYKYSQ